MAITAVPTGIDGAFENPFSRAYNTEADHGFVSRAEDNALTRYFGVTGPSSAIDPYTSGYGYVYFETVPSIVDNSGNAARFLTSKAKSITVPSYTLNVIEYEGLNGMTWGVPGNATLDSKTFTVRIAEVKDTAVINTIARWIATIRDINYGVANMQDYTQSAYKGTVWYIGTDPTGRYAMSAFLFTGVFPTRVPFDALSLDIVTQDRIEPDFEFHFDMMFSGDQVMNKAQMIADMLFNESIGTLSGEYKNAIG